MVKSGSHSATGRVHRGMTENATGAMFAQDGHAQRGPGCGRRATDVAHREALVASMTVCRRRHEPDALISVPDRFEKIGLRVIRIDVEQDQSSRRGTIAVAQGCFPPDE